jgi:hypothetical protein
VALALTLANCWGAHCVCDAHTRSELAVGALNSYCLSPHCVVALQPCEPGRSWKVLVPSHAAQLAAPVAAAYVPGAQFMQDCTAALPLLNWPAPHGRHTPPLAPPHALWNSPAAHLKSHAVQLVAPGASLKVLSGHAVHAL